MVVVPTQYSNSEVKNPRRREPIQSAQRVEDKRETKNTNGMRAAKRCKGEIC